MTRQHGATLVYDGDCGLCTSCVRFVERHIPTDAALVAWQDADLAGLGVARDRAQEAVQWVADDRSVSAGEEAIGRLLRDAGGGWAVLGRILLSPAVAPIAGAVYRVIADHRSRLIGGTPACALPAADRPGASRAATPGRPASLPGHGRPSVPGSVLMSDDGVIRADGVSAPVPGRNDGSAGSVASAGSIGSVASAGSIGSVASSGSIGSIASSGSIGSVLSAGSIGSVASAGSIGSIASCLSIGSVGSFASIGSRGAVGQIFGVPVAQWLAIRAMRRRGARGRGDRPTPRAAIARVLRRGCPGA
jgi:predicted DCC family thiol-disulfide oxidoreductase YuxK